MEAYATHPSENPQPVTDKTFAECGVTSFVLPRSASRRPRTPSGMPK